MNKDIRVTIGLADHPKTVKLIRKCGEGAFRCLLRLWCYAAEYRPSGILHNMDEADIAIASGWNGEDADWVNALAAVGFLDQEDDAYALHDWEIHNPFAFHADERSERARSAAEKRWGKKADANGNAGGMPVACDEHAKGNAPSPNPSPSPKDSEANASGAEDAPPDLKTTIFGPGLKWLAKQSGKSESAVRSWLGKGCSQYGDAGVIEVLGAAQREGPLDPFAWMQRAFKARASPKQSQPSKTRNSVVVGSPEWKRLEAEGMV